MRWHGEPDVYSTHGRRLAVVDSNRQPVIVPIRLEDVVMILAFFVLIFHRPVISFLAAQEIPLWTVHGMVGCLLIIGSALYSRVLLRISRKMSGVGEGLLFLGAIDLFMFGVGVWYWGKTADLW